MKLAVLHDCQSQYTSRNSLNLRDYHILLILGFTLFFVFFRLKTSHFLKKSGEVNRVFNTDLFRDLVEAQIRCLKQILCVFNSFLLDIICEALPNLLPEKAAEVAGAEVDEC